MTRKQVLGILVIMLSATFIMLICIALSPVWVLVLMIKPDIATPLSDYAIKRVTQEITKSMVRGSRSVRSYM